VIAGVAMGFGGLTLGSTRAWAGAEEEEEISHSEEAIHQVAVFKASRKRVYEALTDAKQFDKVIELSGVMQSMHLGNKPAEISREVGGGFALFGGYITGHTSNLRRTSASCRPGEPAVGLRGSIRSFATRFAPARVAKFELVEQGTGSKIVFDHTGFPKGKAEALASGWKAHYWEPLQKFLG
jgi:hypothetical protein